MNHKNILTIGAVLLMTAPAFSATPEKTDDGAKQMLTVNQETVNATVSEIRIDGNNAILLFADGTTLTADMRLVTLTMSYDETTGVSNLNMKDKEGNVKVYDLQGRQVKSGKSGLYIVNGKKVVKKKE